MCPRVEKPEMKRRRKHMEDDKEESQTKVRMESEMGGAQQRVKVVERRLGGP